MVPPLKIHSASCSATQFQQKDMRFTREWKTTSTSKKPAGTDSVTCLLQRKEKRERKTKQAWEFLLRRALKLPSKDPNWLDLPTMMRMVVTTPNVFKQRRPEWLGPFNFFLFPMLSETFGGYPKGFDKSNFIFITPYGVRPQKMEFTRGCQSSGRRVLSNHDAADNKSG